MKIKKDKNNNPQDNIRYEEYIKYMNEVENKKKSIKNFVKGAIATGLVVGSLLTETACSKNTPVDPIQPIDPEQTTIEPIKPEDPVNPKDPKTNESIKTMNRALDIISEHYDNKPVDHVYAQILNQNTASLSFTTYTYNEERGSYMYANMGEYGTYNLTIEEFQDICECLKISSESTKTSMISIDEFITKLSNNVLDNISGKVFEKQNKEKAIDELENILEMIKIKHNFQIEDFEFSYETSEGQKTDYYMYLSCLVGEYRHLKRLEISADEYGFFKNFCDARSDNFSISINGVKSLADSSDLELINKLLLKKEQFLDRDQDSEQSK